MLHHTLMILTDATSNGTPAGTGTAGATAFWNTSAGQILGTLLSVVGVLVVLGGIFNIAKSVMAGKNEKILMKVLITFALAAIAFDPQLIDQAISAFTGVVNGVINSFGSLVGSGGSGNTAGTAAAVIGQHASTLL